MFIGLVFICIVVFVPLMLLLSTCFACLYMYKFVISELLFKILLEQEVHHKLSF